MSQPLFRLSRWCAAHPFRTIGAWMVVAVAVFGVNGPAAAGAGTR